MIGILYGKLALLRAKVPAILKPAPRCEFCGIRTETPCESPPPDTCGHALEVLCSRS
jgi:hypothetical protein